MVTQKLASIKQCNFDLQGTPIAPLTHAMSLSDF